MAEPFRHEIRVRYGEVDMQRVVFNAHYLAYCDDACETWLRHLGVRPADHGWDFMVKKATIEWAGAATLHDTIVITPAVARWGNTSFDVEFEGVVHDRTVFSCVVTYVGVRAGTLETMPPPQAIRAALA